MRAFSILSSALGDLFSDYLRGVQRYPLAFAFSITLTLGLLGVFNEWSGFGLTAVAQNDWLAVLLASVTVFPLAILASVSGREQGRTAWALVCVVLVYLGAVRYIAGIDWNSGASPWDIFPMLLLSWGLAAMLHSYLRRSGQQGFLDDNRSLLVRGIASGVFSLALFAGIAIALAAIFVLFQIDVEFSIYQNLAAVVFGMVMPGHFMAGMPWDQEEESEWVGRIGAYALRYLFIPFTAAYLAILYAYFLRQLILSEWPQGWIGFLSIGLAGLAIFTRYYGERHRWFSPNGFESLILRIIFPAIVAVGIAVVMALNERVEAYGWTELRWAGVWAGVWITALGVYYSIFTKKDLRPGVWLLLFLVLIVWQGPLRAKKIALDRQVDRLVTMESRFEVAKHLDKYGKPDWSFYEQKDRENLIDQYEFFASRHYWSVLDSHSVFWTSYREKRGADEPPLDAWHHLMRGRYAGGKMSGESIQWSLDEPVWLDVRTLSDRGRRAAFVALHQGRNELGDWSVQLGGQSWVERTDGLSERCDFSGALDSVLRAYPPIWKTGPGKMPCFEVPCGDSALEVCVAQLDAHAGERDTVIYTMSVWLFEK